MEDEGLFRTDVTQPFSLGTKCAKTYVTRCLLGKDGTTYKYLGLRMFVHPWNTPTQRHETRDVSLPPSNPSTVFLPVVSPIIYKHLITNGTNADRILRIYPNHW